VPGNYKPAGTTRSAPREAARTLAERDASAIRVRKKTKNSLQRQKPSLDFALHLAQRRQNIGPEDGKGGVVV